MRGTSLTIALGFWAGLAFGQADVEKMAPQYTQTKCPFSIPSGERAECGYLTVPENRSNNAESNIKIFVTIAKSYSHTPKIDPIVVISPMPGVASSERLAQSEYWHALARFRQDRDMIFIDQRGSGYSEPTLQCSNMPNPNLVTEQDYLLKLRECRDQLLKKKVDLTAFNSRESAQDIIDLMRTKAYKRFNILSGSFGSRVALAVAGLQPQLVRSVVFNSAVPVMPGVDLDVSKQANNKRVFEQFFYDCGVDARCRKAFPNLQDMYLQLVRSLPNKVSPGKLSVPYAITKLAEELSHTDAVYYLPQQIYQLAQSNIKEQLSLEQFDRIVGTSSLASVSNSVSQEPYFCYDLGEFVAQQQPQATASSPYFSASKLPVCDVWGKGFALKFLENVARPTTPVLVLTGEYDTVVPARWSRDVAKSLPNAKLFQFKGVGHNVIGTLPCALYMAAAFFDRPDHKPEDACLMALKAPSFFVPEQAEDAALVARGDAQ